MCCCWLNTTFAFQRTFAKADSRVEPEVEEIFRRYSWPGNVRELRNVIERVMILEDSDMITDVWLPRGLMRRASRIFGACCRSRLTSRRSRRHHLFNCPMGN